MELARQIWETTDESARADWDKLRIIAKNISSGSKVGLKFINHYTASIRLHTKNKEKLSFVEFYETRETRTSNYILKYLKNNCKDSTMQTATTKQLYRLYSFYFGSIGVFRPALCMEVLNLFTAKTVLDPTMGWGGRMLACVASGVERYIGIDSNTELVEPYSKMVDNLGEHTTKIDLLFQDALSMDYSTLPTYDMVLTSPPYYNIERYQGQPDRSKKEWKEFYAQLIHATYGHMQCNGHYCINISKEIYGDCYVPILGESDYQIPLNKRQRVGSECSEFIYVWVKRSRLRSL